MKATKGKTFIVTMKIQDARSEPLTVKQLRASLKDLRTHDGTRCEGVYVKSVKIEVENNK